MNNIIQILERKLEEKNGKKRTATVIISTNNMFINLNCYMVIVILTSTIYWSVGMGDWGIGIFENDAAIDWISDFSEDSHPIKFLEETLCECQCLVLNSNKKKGSQKKYSSRYVQECIAAAGLVAALKIERYRKELQLALGEENANNVLASFPVTDMSIILDNAIEVVDKIGGIEMDGYYEEEDVKSRLLALNKLIYALKEIKELN